MRIRHLPRDSPPDLMLSGTVGDARTAMVLDAPAVALSQAFTHRDNVLLEHGLIGETVVMGR